MRCHPTVSLAVLDGIRAQLERDGSVPARMVVGREFAESLAREAFSWRPKEHRDSTEADYVGYVLSLMEAGDCRVFGVSVEAGWTP